MAPARAVMTCTKLNVWLPWLLSGRPAIKYCAVVNREAQEVKKGQRGKQMGTQRQERSLYELRRELRPLITISLKQHGPCEIRNYTSSLNL